MTGCERRSCACWLGCAKACPTVLLHRRSDGPDQRRHARRGLGEDGCAHAWRVGAAPGHKTGSAPHGLLAQCPCAASSTRRRRRGVQATRHTSRAGARLRALLHEVEHGRGHGLSEGKRAAVALASSGGRHGARGAAPPVDGRRRRRVDSPRWNCRGSARRAPAARPGDPRALFGGPDVVEFRPDERPAFWRRVKPFLSRPSGDGPGPGGLRGGGVPFHRRPPPRPPPAVLNLRARPTLRDRRGTAAERSGNRQRAPWPFTEGGQTWTSCRSPASPWP